MAYLLKDTSIFILSKNSSSDRISKKPEKMPSREISRSTSSPEETLEEIALQNMDINSQMNPKILPRPATNF
ncbi:hypothetical protein C2G38_2253867 [Gigaspora rosea]|uniref:Uncharacterized protein n=1 Tax=Gigaspora rosea TaxID=44941 RepID=A0A397U8D9_9GLOM|nr:hypothetical protein C2G38_2253867 [Gigaspora rosea]